MEKTKDMKFEYVTNIQHFAPLTIYNVVTSRHINILQRKEKDNVTYSDFAVHLCFYKKS